MGSMSRFIIGVGVVGAFILFWMLGVSIGSQISGVLHHLLP